MAAWATQGISKKKNKCRWFLFFYKKKADFHTFFLHGQRSVAESGPTPSPRSICFRYQPKLWLKISSILEFFHIFMYINIYIQCCFVLMILIKIVQLCEKVHHGRLCQGSAESNPDTRIERVRRGKECTNSMHEAVLENLGQTNEETNKVTYIWRCATGWPFNKCFKSFHKYIPLWLAIHLT